MHSQTPIAFHHRRIETLSNTLGGWITCDNASCRRAGACRRADAAFPPCLLPVVLEVGECVRACAAPLAGLPTRPATENPVNTQLARISRRVGDLLEAQIERMERKLEKRRADEHADAPSCVRHGRA